MDTDAQFENDLGRNTNTIGTVLYIISVALLADMDQLQRK